MKDLIERLERASGPDRELDGRIWCALNGYVFLEWDGAGCRFRAKNNGWIGHNNIKEWTASLDAALTLVPEGYRWLVGNAWKDKHGDCPAMASVVVAGDYGGRPTSAATPALALCIAALKARSASEMDMEAGR